MSKYKIRIIKDLHMKKKESKDYLSNKEMYAEIVICQEKNVMSDKLGKMFVLLATHYATKPKFSGYSYRDEMVDAGITACCVAFNKFNPQRSVNTFAYFTTCIHNAFLQILNKEKTQREIRDKLLLNADMNPSFGYSEGHKNKDENDEAG